MTQNIPLIFMRYRWEFSNTTTYHPGTHGLTENRNERNKEKKKKGYSGDRVKDTRHGMKYYQLPFAFMCPIFVLLPKKKKKKKKKRTPSLNHSSWVGILKEKARNTFFFILILLKDPPTTEKLRKVLLLMWKKLHTYKYWVNSQEKRKNRRNQA